MSDKKIRVGVVGVGDFGRNHVRVFHELPGAELVGIHDVDPERARQIAAEFGTQAFSDIGQLAEQIDAVSVAVPTILHARISSELCSGAWMCWWRSRLRLRAQKPTD